MDDFADFLWILAGAWLLLAIFAAFAELRRARRRDLDRAGCVSWNLIQVLAFLLAVVCAALAFKG